MEVEADLQESIAKALENRPEYSQAKLDLENSNISIKVAENRKLPILDLEGSFSLNGLGDGLGEPFSQIGGVDYSSWDVGLALRMPLGERDNMACGTGFAPLISRDARGMRRATDARP